MPVSNIIGKRHDGRPIWALAFGAEGEGGGEGGSGGEGEGGETPPEGGAVGPDGLNEAGRNAIRGVREELRTAKAGWRPYREVFSELGIESPEQLRERLAGGQKQQKQDPPVDAEQIRRAVEKDLSAKYTRQLLSAEVRAQAAGSFADPDDAWLHLQGKVDDLVDDNGAPDRTAIDDALGDLLKRKTHLAKTKEAPPSFDGGARSTTGSPQSAADFFRGEVRRARRR